MKRPLILDTRPAVACSSSPPAATTRPASTADTRVAGRLGRGGKITKNADNAEGQLTIGSKNFTEQKVLGEIYAQGLEAAGYTVSKDLNLGDEKTALAAVKSDEISAYPEYTGTALLSFFGKQADELPKDPQAAYEEAKQGFEADGLTAFPPTPFTSSNEVAVTAETAEKLGLKNISDLEGKSQDLTLYGSPECRQRLDCLLGLEQVYGLEFKKFVPVDVAQRHEVLTSGRADVSIVFTTDPQIQRENEVLLEDDKGMFPPYNSTLVMKQGDGRRGGARPREDHRPDPGAADRREHAGAQRPRGPRQEGSRRGRQGVPHRDGPDRRVRRPLPRYGWCRPPAAAAEVRQRVFDLLDIDAQASASSLATRRSVPAALTVQRGRFAWLTPSALPWRGVDRGDGGGAAATRTPGALLGRDADALATACGSRRPCRTPADGGGLTPSFLAAAACRSPGRGPLERRRHLGHVDAERVGQLLGEVVAVVELPEVLERRRRSDSSTPRRSARRSSRSRVRVPGLLPK